MGFAYSHQVARDDICPLFQKGSSNDNARNRVKFPPPARRALSAELTSCKPSLTQRDHADADPRHVQPRGRIGAQIKRVDDRSIRHDIKNRADPAEDVNDDVDGHKYLCEDDV